MAKKKKAKKAVKAKKALKVKKTAKAKKIKKEKVLGRVEHFFDKISVAAIVVKAPIKVGDVVHIKGHTTDFFQKVESMQIEHQSVTKVKKGDDVGIKVKEKVRDHDTVYLADEKALAAQAVKPGAAQAPLFSKPEPKKADPYSGTKFLNF